MILRGKMKKIVRIVLDLITWILVAAVVGYLVLLLTGHELYVVKSGSMEPAIHTGSVCIVNTNADYDDMKVGDIVVEYIYGGNFYESIDAKERKVRSERVGQLFKNNARSIATI